MFGIIVIVVDVGLALLLFAFAWTSFREGEPRAGRLAILLGFVLSLVLTPLLWAPVSLQAIAVWGIFALFVILLPVFMLPVGNVALGSDTPDQRYDERDIVFSRARLVPGSANYDAYYESHPEKRAGDERNRSLPGILSPQSRYAEPLAFAAANANFSLTEALREDVDGEVGEKQFDLDPAVVTPFLKGFAQDLGAVHVGVTQLRPYHVYSHVGRGSGCYGDPIHLEHKFALAFSVEMDHAVMAKAPLAPVVAESAHQYVEAAKIAIVLAAWMRSMGFAARAHIDGNYRVIAPLVARDAGLGEIGRIGLLITPSLGPRVRLGVVTTNLPLMTDDRYDGRAMIDFCNICKKCAQNCPSHSLPLGAREEYDGALRWRMNPDTCFRYWNVSGTDCGICMAVCPYSHPDNWAHNAVRWAIARSGVARRAALWMDDFFYGRTFAIEDAQPPDAHSSIACDPGEG